LKIIFSKVVTDFKYKLITFGDDFMESNFRKARKVVTLFQYKLVTFRDDFQ